MLTRYPAALLAGVTRRRKRRREHRESEDNSHADDGEYGGETCRVTVTASPAFDASSLSRLLSSLGLAAGIGIGAALQGVAGAWLVRKFVGIPTRLIDSRQVFGFMAVGGLVGCVVAPTWGVSTLVVWGLVPHDDFTFHWFTWWVGDAIGVLIFAPLLVLWLEPNNRVARGALAWITTASCLTCALATVLYLIASNAEQNRLEQDFHRRVTPVHQRIANRLDSYAAALESIESLF